MNSIGTRTKELIGPNFFFMVWSGSIGIANSLVVWIAFTRTKDIVEVGNFAIMMGLYALFYGIVGLGLQPYLINEIRERGSQNDPVAKVTTFVSSAAVFLGISGIAAACLMTATGYFLADSTEVFAAIAILSISMIPSGIDAVAESVAIAYEQTRIVAVIATIENLLRTAVPLALILSGYGLIPIAIAFAIIRFTALIVYAITARRHLANFDLRRAEVSRLARITPTFAGTIVLANLNWQLPMIVLGFISVASELAILGTSARFLIPVSILMGSFANAVHPTIVDQVKLGASESLRCLSRLVALPLTFAMIAVGCSVLFGGSLLAALFGESYRAASQTLTVLAMCAAPFCVVMIAARALVATSNQRIDLIANVVGVVICATAAVTLTPEFGAVGAAVSQFLAFSVMAAIETIFLLRIFAPHSARAVSAVGILAFLRSAIWNK